MAGFWKSMTGRLGGAEEASRPERDAAAASLTGGELGMLLTNLGYGPEPLPRPDGTAHGFRFQGTATGGWAAPMHAFIGLRLNTVNIMATLREIQEPDTLPAVYWSRLLTANDLTAPCYFFWLHDLRRLFLVERFPNQGVDAGYLKVRIDDLLLLAQKTEEHWNPAS